MVERHLDILEVGDHTILHLLRQFHILHSRVSCIDLALELSRLLVQIWDDQCHITEDIGIDDGTHCDEAGYKGDLEGASGQYIVTGQQKHGMVKCDEVLVAEGRIVVIWVWVDVIQRW